MDSLNALDEAVDKMMAQAKTTSGRDFCALFKKVCDEAYLIRQREIREREQFINEFLKLGGSLGIDQ